MKTPIFSLVLILFLFVSCENKRPTIKDKYTTTPIVSVAPNYPRKQAVAAIEGWVNLQFTITKTGNVKTPIVLDSYPKGVFDKEAIRAILKYKFKPMYVKGKNVEQQVTQVIEFKLAK